MRRLFSIPEPPPPCVNSMLSCAAASETNAHSAQTANKSFMKREPARAAMRLKRTFESEGEPA